MQHSIINRHNIGRSLPSCTMSSQTTSLYVKATKSPKVSHWVTRQPSWQSSACNKLNHIHHMRRPSYPEAYSNKAIATTMIVEVTSWNDDWQEKRPKHWCQNWLNITLMCPSNILANSSHTAKWSTWVAAVRHKWCSSIVEHLNMRIKMSKKWPPLDQQ